jgi:type IV pilus assembly protein PilB
VGAKTDSNTAVAATDGAGPGRAALGQLLVRGGHISPVQLDQALEEGSRTGERLGEVVVKRGWATEDDVARLLAEQWDLSYVDRASIWFDANALARLSREDAQRLEALPTRIEDGRVVAAVAEPTEHRLEALRKLLGDETVVIVVPKSALEAGLRSDLLPSRGAGGEDGDAAAPSTDGETEATDGESPPPQLRAVEPLPDTDAADGDSTVDSVVALAAQARGIADMLAEQAASIRSEAARADTAAAEKLAVYEGQIESLEAQVAELQARVEGLEGDLVERQQAMDGTAERLEELVRLLREPEPAEAAAS